MGSRALTETDWNNLLTAFREAPGNILRAHKQTGLAAATCRKAWLKGWPRTSYGATPIQKLIEDEQDAARQARWKAERDREELEIQRRIQARIDAEQARKEEGEGVKVARRNAINSGVISAKLLIYIDKLVGILVKRLEADATGKAISDVEIRKWLQTAAIVTHRTQIIFKLALEHERVVLGEPTRVIGLKLENATPEHIARELQGIERTMRRAGALGMIDPESSADVN